MFTPEGGLEPLLAESFDQPDELTYVYTLREGITFGAPLYVTFHLKEEKGTKPNVHYIGKYSPRA